MHIVVANPRGFCAGVERAVLIVERALEEFGAPVYVRHEIVHNHHVVAQLRQRGAVFVDEVDEIPPGARAVFSAHGVSPVVVQAAQARALQTLDATCPLVTKVHLEVARHARAGRSVVLVGHAGHAEVEGTMGHFRSVAGAAGPQIHLIGTEAEAQALVVAEPGRLAYATQTTLSVDDTARILAVLQRRFPGIQGPPQDDICYATQNRQMAVRALAERTQLVLVVGAAHSSNSMRLLELAGQCGRAAHLITGAGDLQRAWFDGVGAIGLTAGASVPEPLVQGVIAQLRAWWPEATLEEAGEPERVVFPLPMALRRAVRPAGASTAAPAVAP